MTQVILNIKNKRDLPFLKRLSKNMGWTISEHDIPNAETIAAMREAESGIELEVLLPDNAKRQVHRFRNALHPDPKFDGPDHLDFCIGAY